MLVGHSLAGLSVRAFVGTYPAQVGGVVLFDPTPVEYVRAHPATFDGIGWDIPTTVTQVGAVTRWPAVPTRVLSADPEKDIAAGVTAADEREWQTDQRSLAALAAATLDVVPGAGHYIFTDKPVVAAAAVLAVLARATYATAVKGARMATQVWESPIGDADLDEAVALCLQQFPGRPEHMLRFGFLDPAIHELASTTVRVDGELVAYARLARRDGMPPAERWTLVVVAPDQQGVGIGGRLLCWLLARVDHGAGTLRSVVDDHDPRSLAVAQHWGYTVYEHGIASRLDLHDLPRQMAASPQ